MSKQPIPIILLLEMNDNGNIDSLRVWMRLKNLYKTQIIFNFNYHSLSIKSGFSRTALRKHIPVLERFGMVERKSGHLFLTGVNKLKRHENSKCALIPIKSNKNEQIAEIRYAIVRYNIDRQKAEIARKEKALILFKTGRGKKLKRVYKMVKQAGGIKKFRKSFQKKTVLSNQRFGSIFNLSMYSGRNIQEKLRELCLIKAQPTYVFIKHNSSKQELKYLGGMYRLKGSDLFKRGANAITT